MPFKILTTADLHLGKKSSNVPRNLDESSTRFTWHRIVEYAVVNEIDALILAGDVVDRDNRYFEARGPIQEGFERLQDAEIPVVMVAGNHDFDVLTDVIRNREYDHVHLLGEQGTWESYRLQNPKGAIQFIGWSFPSRYVGEDPSIQDWSVNLDPNLPTIGILHGDIADSSSKYAPINLNNLIGGLVDSWVLGHIHKPGILRESEPLIFYPGSPHALSSKEPGQHGPFLLTIEGREAIRYEQIALSPIRYDRLEIDITGVENESEFRNRITSRLSGEVQNNVEKFEQAYRAIYDVILTGKHSSLSELDRWGQWAREFEQELMPETLVSIRTVVNKVEPKVENLQQLAGQPTPPGILAQAILDLQNGRQSEFIDHLSKQFKTKLEGVNSANTYQPLRLQDPPLTASSDDARDYLLRECQHLLGELLLQKEHS
ncbi:exonuclease SbcCD subunit D [Halalkalibaculum sp. DA384]|uniref:metallophosphoesterase family protein n=1 Tax=Halalkalibaculum sp. DA384 TaxID=3373606 RepID=UPI003754C0B5